MQRSQRTTSSFAYIISLCLLFLITTGPVNADNIKTQNARLLLQLGQANLTPDAASEIKDIQNLQLPSDVTILNNRIYVVDGSHHRIAVYSQQGGFLFSFGSRGSENGQLLYPVGIDAGKDKRIYVADSGNRRIQVFSETGKYLSGFTVTGKDSRSRPIDVIRHSRTGHIVVSNSDHRIRVYSRKGKLLRTWGKNGTSRSEFRYPATLNELADGRIAVVDVLNSRVQVFHLDGSLSLVVGQWGVLPGQLFRPKGIAIDRKGNFYISDSYMGVVQQYADDGLFRGVLGDKGEPFQMLTPVGMTVYRNKLYVVEMQNNRVSVYQLEN